MIKGLKLFVSGLLLMLSISVYAAQCENGVFKLYMSGDGNDMNLGSENNPLATLGKAHEVVNQIRPSCNIEIHINKGLYFGQSVVWTYTNGYSITLTAANYGGENDRPIFIGSSSSGIWFDLNVRNGAYSNVRFKYIKVMNYGGGIRLFGDRENKEGGWNGGNEIYGMVFENIGGKHRPNYNGGVGYAAVNTFNSRGNVIRNNDFINIENDANCPGCMHGVYLAHYSSNNMIDYNYFENVSGNPVQNRDQSNFNTYKYNDFKKTGYVAQIQDWYCTGSKCTKNGRECPSHSVTFSNNYYGLLYNNQPTVYLAHAYGDDDYCGLLPGDRITVTGNVETVIPDARNGNAEYQ